MNPILSQSDQGALSYLKVGFMGFKEFGSGDGPLPQSPGSFLFSILSVAQTALLLRESQSQAHLHYKVMVCVISNMLQSGLQIIVALNSWKSHTLLVPEHQMDFFIFSSVSCSHGQIEDLDYYQTFGSLKTRTTTFQMGAIDHILYQDILDFT